MVPRRGLEPPRPFDHWHLKPARLPIPPPGPKTGGPVRGGRVIGHWAGRVNASFEPFCRAGQGAWPFAALRRNGGSSIRGGEGLLRAQVRQ